MPTTARSACCSVERAIILVLLQKADLVEAHSDRFVRSTSLRLPWPSIVRLKFYVRVPYKADYDLAEKCAPPGPLPVPVLQQPRPPHHRPRDAQVAGVGVIRGITSSPRARAVKHAEGQPRTPRGGRYAASSLNHSGPVTLCLSGTTSAPWTIRGSRISSWRSATLSRIEGRASSGVGEGSFPAFSLVRNAPLAHTSSLSSPNPRSAVASKPSKTHSCRRPPDVVLPGPSAGPRHQPGKGGA